MALIDIDKIKKSINKVADNVANTVSGAAKNVGDGVSEFSTNIIVRILNGVDIDAVLKATETYGQQSGKDVSATVKFLNNLKSIRDGK